MRFVQHFEAAAAASLLLAVAVPARAHICLELPMSRVGPMCSTSSAQKPGPCGINMRGTKYVQEYRPGETITVTLNETVNHKSHYRVAFNPNGDTFEDPASIDDKDGKHPFVLLDNITDETDARQSVQVTLPNITCDKCTLQLIQVMYDKTANGFGNDDIYYACADIVLKGTPVAPGDAAPSADAGLPARPAADASSPAQEPWPPPQTGDAGANSDASSGPVGMSSTDSGTGAPHTDQDASSDAGEEDEDSGGCAVAQSGSQDGRAWLAPLLALGALLHRRRRRS